MTIYINPSLNHQNSSRFNFEDTNCGPRCGYVEIFRFTSKERNSYDLDLPYGDYFQCSTTVSRVLGVKVDMEDHHLPDITAIRAASSIGANFVFSAAVSGAQQIIIGAE